MPSLETILEHAADEFLTRYRSGERPNIEDYVRDHPDCAAELREMLSGIALMESLSECETAVRRIERTHHRRDSLTQLGDFDILGELGRGGMGVVYEAEDRTLKRRVALKVLHDGAFSTDAQLKRFHREAQLAARLHHTNIVSVFGSGVVSGRHFFAMQYVPGQSLDHVLGELRKQRGSETPETEWPDEAFPGHPAAEETDWQRIARMGLQVTEALAYAHSQGILHRDIKPANLLLDAQGTVWITDFGLAKLSDQEAVTKTGDMVGTLKYMAPEQLSGHADARSDVYALGLTLYELLTRGPACCGATVKELVAHKQQPDIAPPRKLEPSVPRDLDTIVMRMLQAEPEKRYPNAASVAEDLRRFLEDRPIHARRVTVLEHTMRWCRRNRLVASLATLCLLLLVTLPVVLGVAYMQAAHQKQQTSDTLDIALIGFDALFRSYLGDEPQFATSFDAGGVQADAQHLAPALLSDRSVHMLEGMLGVYDALARQHAGSHNRILLEESARAARRVGVLYQKLGRFDKARTAFEEATAGFQELARTDATFGVQLAELRNAQGILLAERRDFDGAQEEFEQALTALAALPTLGTRDFAMARSHYLLARYREGEHRGPPSERGRHRSKRRPVDSVDAGLHLVTAISMLEDLQQADPEGARVRFLLALCLREAAAGVVFRDPSSPRARAVQLLEQLAREYPHTPAFRFELSETLRGSHDHPRVAAEDSERFIEQLLEAESLLSQLIREQPQIAAYRMHAAHVHAHLGLEFGRARNSRQAEAYSRRGLRTRAARLSRPGDALRTTGRQRQAPPGHVAIPAAAVRGGPGNPASPRRSPAPGARTGTVGPILDGREHANPSTVARRCQASTGPLSQSLAFHLRSPARPGRTHKHAPRHRATTPRPARHGPFDVAA